jgi:hypothetical protein
MNKDTKVLDRLFEQYNIPLSIDDCSSQRDYEWCYYTNNDFSITVDAFFNYNSPNEYEATVYLNNNDNDGIEKKFKEGEEMELIKFITTEKLKLAEERKLEQIKKDF